MRRHARGHVLNVNLTIRGLQEQVAFPQPVVKLGAIAQRMVMPLGHEIFVANLARINHGGRVTQLPDDRRIFSGLVHFINQWVLSQQSVFGCLCRQTNLSGQQASAW